MLTRSIIFPFVFEKQQWQCFTATGFSAVLIDEYKWKREVENCIKLWINSIQFPE